MAVVKILSITTPNHTSHAISYIENPDKTENQVYVSGYACEPSQAGAEFLATKLAAETVSHRPRTDKRSIEAYHIIQSFAPGEITPEQAHEIGQQLAGELLGGKYEYVIATHVDRDHVHNHIILNSVSFYDYKKFRTQPYKTVARLREISDSLCLANDLSVIRENGTLPCSYKEWKERKNGTSWKSQIRKRLNFILKRARSYEEFKQYCVDLGLYYSDKGKQNTFRMVGQERNIRGDTLDKDGGYSVSNLIEQCNQNQEQMEYLQRTLVELIPKSINLLQLYDCIIQSSEPTLLVHLVDVEMTAEPPLKVSLIIDTVQIAGCWIGKVVISHKSWNQSIRHGMGQDIVNRPFPIS